MNVLEKIVIPRIRASVAYIKSELEEFEREDFTRLKMVKKKKHMKIDNDKAEPEKEDAKVTCSVCQTVTEKSDSTISDPILLSVTCCVQEAALKDSLENMKVGLLQKTDSEKKLCPVCFEDDSKNRSKIKLSTSEIKDNIPQEDICGSCKSFCSGSKVTKSEPSINEPLSTLTMNPRVESIYKPVTSVSFEKESNLKDSLDSFEKESNLRDRLEHLKQYLCDLKKYLISAGFNDVDVYLNMCEELKSKLEECLKNNTAEKSFKEKFDRRLESLQSHLEEVIDMEKDFKDIAKLTPSIQSFIQTCKVTDKKLRAKNEKKKIKNKDPVKLDRKDALSNHEIEKILDMISKLKTEDVDIKKIVDYVNSKKRKTKSPKNLSLSSISRKNESKGQKNVTEPDSNIPCKPSTANNDNCISENCYMPDEKYVGEENLDIASETLIKSCDFCDNSMVGGENCPICEDKVITAEKKSEPENKLQNKSLSEYKPENEPVDNSLGYFIHKLRRKLKVIRTQNKDGTIREERETITVKTQKHNPTVTALDDDNDDDDDDDDENDDSYNFSDSEEFSFQDKEDDKQIATYAVPNNKLHGSLNKNKSGIAFRASSIRNSASSKSISLDTVTSCCHEDCLLSDSSHTLS